MEVKMKKLLILCTVIFLLGGMILAGCAEPAPTTPEPAKPAPTTPEPAKPAPTTPEPAKPAPTTPEPTQPTDAEKYGGTLRMYALEPYSLGYPPSMTGQTDGQSSSVCLETLFRFDEKSSLVPLLATDWTADPAAKTITITLRKGVSFQDGAAFNAEACKFNLDLFREGSRKELDNVSSVDIIDDYTVQLNLSKYDNLIASHLASDAGRMISPKAYQENGAEWCEKHPVGTGPFKFVSWEPDVMITWERFDDYWDGKPYIEAIEMLRIADATVALMAFKNGDLDILNPSPKDAKDLEAEGKYNIVTPPEGQFPSLGGNSKDPNSPFYDIRVRRAISYAIDVPALADAFGLGYWKVTNQWAIPDTWAYNTDVVGYPYDPAKAIALLEEAGYNEDNPLKCQAHFFNLGQQYVDEMTAIQDFLKDVGIEAELDGLQRPGFVPIASTGAGWEGIARLQGFSKPDPLIFLINIGGREGIEFSEVARPPEFLDLYEKAVMAPDFATKQKYTQEMMKVAADDYCMVTYLYAKGSPLAKSQRLHDDLYGEVPYRYLSPKAWLSE
jgi:peptide/nickel transport system substrate-binding protein